jgi:valyl-tRNA synthetase
MDKTYNPSFENEIYLQWQNSGYFKPKSDTQKGANAKKFSMVIPPPNITGQLHMGHALNNTTQDFFARYKRMKGFDTLWVPGTDHASIATEVKIVEQLAKEGISKTDLTRDEFLVKAWAWKEKYGNRIVEQLKKLGSSADWTRLAFTMDKEREKAVLHIFKKLYDDGLIYQGERIINWCCHCKTALSDAEVEHEERDSSLWHINYPLEDGSGFVAVATTRPETMLGDVAVAVNPNDKRYKKLVGKNLILPLVGRKIPIIADSYVLEGFGTGAVKITPAHDPNDFEIGLRHNLPVIKVMGDDAVMNDLAGAFSGQDRYICRENVVNELKKQGFLQKIEPHKINFGLCYRCDTIVEPMISKQWFVKMDELVKPSIEAVSNKDLTIRPKNIEKIYLHWVENIKDWCISRQLWWGHRIPVYYCGDCGFAAVEIENPLTCPKCKSANLTQDEDVLDTWFSSALWPFSTLGWPDKTEDLERFYPTDLLVTAQDIIFFWVARMVFMGYYVMGKCPFKDVSINGIVRGADGLKMSKSAGNGVDPLEILEKYGADALRFSLVFGNGTGNDFRFSEQKVINDRTFINKIWNASRFVLMCADGVDESKAKGAEPNIFEKWIFNKFNQTLLEVEKYIDNFDTGMAVKTMYEFVWNDFCDWYIELIKPYVYSTDETIKASAVVNAKVLLARILKLLHPIIPFVTEKIYQDFNSGSIMVENYPNKFDIKNAQEIAIANDVIEFVQKIRETLITYNVDKKTETTLIVGNNAMPYGETIKKLTGVKNITESESVGGNDVKIVANLTTAYLKISVNLENIAKEKEKTEKEMAKILGEIARCEGMLKNQGFMQKASPALIDTEREKLVKFYSERDRIKEKLNALIN